MADPKIEELARVVSVLVYRACGPTATFGLALHIPGVTPSVAWFGTINELLPWIMQEAALQIAQYRDPETPEEVTH